MLHHKYKSFLNFTTLLLLVSLFFINMLVKAQAQKSVEIDIPRNSIDNLIKGIDSDNYDVKKNHIFFAGKYCIKAARKALIEEFSKTSDEELQALIAWSLFRICNKRCIGDLDKINHNLKSEKLKVLLEFFKSLKTYNLTISYPGNRK